LDGKIAGDLVANRPLTYDMTSLTGRDGRRRSAIKREMAARNWGVYDVHTDVWTLSPERVLAYFYTQYGTDAKAASKE